MSCFSHLGLAGLMLLGCANGLSAEDRPKAEPAQASPPASASGAKSVAEIAELVRQSVVVIRVMGRDGKRHGLGTGFVVHADGLIATNLHVIGEGRPISVQLADGKNHEVISVEASDRSLDLALIRVAAKNLTPLELGDSDRLKDGQPIVTVGNPHGLTHSVVSGVVSGKRTIDGRPMIQVAIPVEPGNSGGPLLDMRGRVQGIITMKSLVTANLGFAAAGNLLKPLLKKPNPIPMSRWLTIGALDVREWQPLFGARWRQRGGRIVVDGLGSGFGGRSLCLSQRPVPPVPFELAVTVKLDDEAGAAGLVFHADGDKHYGFYPSGGQLRLTRFDGPDVYSWKILKQESSSFYRPGDWNTLKVRIEKERLRCYVNEHLAFEVTDTGLTNGKVGLAKFRETHAEFKNFQVARQIDSAKPSHEVSKRIATTIAGLALQEAPQPEAIDALAPDAPASVAALRERAKHLDQQAVQLRQLAVAVHQRRVLAELVKVVQGKEEDIDLVHGALLIARLDNDELEVEGYRKEVERMAREIAAGLGKTGDEKAKLAALNKYLFAENGFHGSRSDYYNRSNSYLNEVLDDREGLPITLSVLYVELARRLGLKVVGVGLPGHFVVRHEPAKGEGQLIDVYEGGQPLSREDADKKVRAMTDRPLEEKDLAAVAKRAILVRMLHNLMGIARGNRDAEGMLRYVDAILTLTPDAAEERWMRALLRYQANRRQEAMADADWLLEHKPAGMNLERVLEFRRMLER